MTIISQHWNTVVRDEKRQEMKPRTHVRASELGYPLIDRYLKMRGVQPTNDFSDRVLRIFDAGNVIEFIVMRALAMAGILNRRQAVIELPETDKYLRVTGHLDATLGGFADWDEALKRAKENLGDFRMSLDDALVDEKAQAIIDGLRKEYPDGWSEEMVVEVKSINSMSFWAHKNKAPGGHFLGYDHNRLQLYAYLKMTGLRQGLLLYVSKDDLVLEEVPILNGDPELELALWADLAAITGCIRGDIMPTAEPPVVWNERKQVYETNWNVERSPYLSLVYGYDNQEAFQKVWHQEILDVNRALRHMRDGKGLKGDAEERMWIKYALWERLGHSQDPLAGGVK